MNAHTPCTRFALPRRPLECAALIRAFYGERPSKHDKARGIKAYVRFLLLVPRENGGFYGIDDDEFANVGPKYHLSFQDRIEAGSTVVREWHEMSAAVAAREDADYQRDLQNKRDLDRLERAAGNTNPVFEITTAA